MVEEDRVSKKVGEMFDAFEKARNAIERLEPIDWEKVPPEEKERKQRLEKLLDYYETLEKVMQDTVRDTEGIIDIEENLPPEYVTDKEKIQKKYNSFKNTINKIDEEMRRCEQLISKYKG
jgi:hypothetical protein